MNKRKLFLDFDSTIVNSLKSYCEVYNEIYVNHPNFKHADFTKCNKWDLSDIAPLEKNAADIFSSKLFFDKLEFFDGARETIEELCQDYEVYICSIGTYMNIYHKSLWIKENLPSIKKAILLCNEDSFVDKSVINMENSIFIDDNSKNLFSTNASVKIAFGKVFSWNQDWEGVRIFEWGDSLLDSVRALEHKYEKEKGCKTTTLELHNMKHYYNQQKKEESLEDMVQQLKGLDKKSAV